MPSRQRRTYDVPDVYYPGRIYIETAATIIDRQDSRRRLLSKSWIYSLEEEALTLYKRNILSSPERPSFNGCSLGNPCSSTCSNCTHFNIGQEVLAYFLSEGCGKPVVLLIVDKFVTSYPYSIHGLWGFSLSTHPDKESSVTRYAYEMEHLSPHDENDIDYYGMYKHGEE